MNKQPGIFDRVLRGDLRPWLESNKHDEKFIHLIGDLKLTTPEFEPVYEIDFYRCFNSKTKYYQKLIINEANNYCNSIIDLIRSDDDIRIVRYLLSDMLKKKLKTLLKDVGKLIKVNGYDLKYINPYKSDPDTDKDHKSDTYVLQLLKTALIKVYLEIQEVFSDNIPQEEYMEMEDLYLQVVSEPIPEQPFLKKRILIVVNNSDTLLNTIHTQVPLVLYLHSFTYKQLVKKGDSLIDLCDNLKSNHFIDEKTSIAHFKRVFSGKEILNPVRWTGNGSEFYFFIYLIYTKHKLVKDLKQNQWKVACRCFVKEDGTAFDKDKIKNLKRPQLTGGLIEKAVELLF